MSGLIISGVMAFVATNVDDILLLVFFFSQVQAAFRPRHVVTGQYLGLAILVSVSLLGCLGRLIIPRPWLGWLGVIPIGMGIWQLPGRKKAANSVDGPPVNGQLTRLPLPRSGLLHPHAYQVAAVTVANGGDNIGIYTPLFASRNLAELTMLLLLFGVLMGVWCFVGYHLAHKSAVVAVMMHYGHIVVPIVLIGLGIFILRESGTLAFWGL